MGLDAIVEADETPTGDGLLELLDRWGTLPLSPAWIGEATPHSTGRQWRRVHTTELAICAAQELPWAHLRRWRG